MSVNRKVRLREYYLRNKQDFLTKARAYHWENRERILPQKRGRSFRLKLEIILHYSPNGICQCASQDCWHVGPCHVSDPRVLTVDHIQGKGNQHRKEIGGYRQYSGSHIYFWIQRNNFPPLFQILCINCNFVKGPRGLPKEALVDDSDLLLTLGEPIAN